LGEKYKYKDFSGVISDNGERITIFKKEVKNEDGKVIKTHVYKNLRSFGIPNGALNELITKGIQEVVIIFRSEMRNEDKELVDATEELFKTDIVNWKFGRIVEHTGYEVQRHLTISNLRKITKSLIVG